MARLTVAVDPEGLPTKLYLVAAHGRVSISSASASAGAGIKARRVRLVIHGLREHARYSVYGVAKSAAGTVKSAMVTATTPKH